MAEGAAARGRFITFEGGEGCGKSTQSRLLAEWLRARGKIVVATREPGGSPGAETIRRLLVEGEPGRWGGVSEVMLLSAARRDHVDRTIRPALQSGAWVICDRFTDSTVAYQGYGGGVDFKLIEQLTAVAVGDVKPDLTLILDLPVEVGLARAGGRGAGEDRFERKDVEFHRRLRRGFLAIARDEPGRCVVISAEPSIETVEADIRAVVGERLGTAAP